jgi:hypothetical protein
VFDAFCFALFAVGALIDPGNFPIEADERNVTWSTMLRAYGKAFPTDPILNELDRMILKNYRYSECPDTSRSGS